MRDQGNLLNWHNKTSRARKARAENLVTPDLEMKRLLQTGRHERTREAHSAAYAIGKSASPTGERAEMSLKWRKSEVFQSCLRHDVFSLPVLNVSSSNLLRGKRTWKSHIPAEEPPCAPFPNRSAGSALRLADCRAGKG